MKNQPGFSLIECMVAALVLSAGVLALVASTAFVQRLSLLGRRTAGAAETAASRLSALSVTACDSAAAGTASGVFDEAWSVSPAGRLRAATVAVTFVHDHRPRTIRFDAAWLCPPP